MDHPRPAVVTLLGRLAFACTLAVLPLPAAAAEARGGVEITTTGGCATKAVQREVARRDRALQRCFRQAAGEAQVRLRFDGNGQRRDLRVTGGVPGHVRRCLDKHLQPWRATPIRQARRCEVQLAIRGGPSGDGHDRGTDRPHAEQERELGH